MLPAEEKLDLMQCTVSYAPEDTRPLCIVNTENAVHVRLEPVFNE